MTKIPVLPRRMRKRTFHGHVFSDPYAWVREDVDAAMAADPPSPASSEILAHLEAENVYTAACTEELSELQSTIVQEIAQRTKETDVSVPTYYRGWWYFTRTLAGQSYARSTRMKDADFPGYEHLPEPSSELLPGEILLLDGNIEAADSEYYSSGGVVLSPNEKLMAIPTDKVGDERYNISVRHVPGSPENPTPAESYPPASVDEAVTGVTGDLIWDYDSKGFFYTRHDAAWRPCEVWYHQVGTSMDADELLFTEPDEGWWVGLGGSHDDATLIIGTASVDASEMHLADLRASRSGRLPELTCVQERTPGLEYRVAVDGEHLFIVHNRNYADFEIAICLRNKPESSQWQSVFAPSAGEHVSGLSLHKDFLVITGRSETMKTIWLLDRRDPQARPETLDTAEEICTLSLGGTPEYDTETIRVHTQSLVTPGTIWDVHLETGEWAQRKTQEVPGYNPQEYQQKRLWAQAEDGTQIPVSLVAHREVEIGDNPGILYGYGAYENSSDPYFSVPRLSLLDRGVVYAIAHVRGGGEGGRIWYEQGRRKQKPNSFSDLVAAARMLQETGWVSSERLGLIGGSAGGLLVGAAINLAPNLFRAVLAKVPFVDALTTILNPELPLTIREWEEWGNPLTDPEIYELMRSYTPYENVQNCAYPAILATTSLHDPRVSFVEPVKWVAELRHSTTGSNPILLKTAMSAGHGGKSGRYAAWEEIGAEYAFLLWQLGGNHTEKSFSNQ